MRRFRCTIDVTFNFKTIHHISRIHALLVNLISNFGEGLVSITVVEVQEYGLTFARPDLQDAQPNKARRQERATAPETQITKGST